MLGKSKRKKLENLQSQLSQTNMRLALMKVELAAQMIRLAGQTSDSAPLNEAEDALSAARNYYNFENTPIEVGLVQVALGDMYVKLGREKNDKPAFVEAKKAYRYAITLASLHGDDDLRNSLRDKIKLVEALLGQGPKTPSLFRAA